MRYVEDPRFEQRIARDPVHRKAMLGVAGEAKRKAEAIAPIGPTRIYHRSFILEQDLDGVALGSTDWAAHFVEFGSVNNAPFRTLRTAARLSGLRVKDTPKPPKS